MSLLAVSRHEDLLVLRPVGRLDRTWLPTARAALFEGEAPVVVDLDECIVLDRGVLVDLCRLLDEARCEACFVSPRATCRLLLTRTGVGVRFPVFDRFDDALLARTQLAAAGGRGWGSVSAPRRTARSPTARRARVRR